MRQPGSPGTGVCHGCGLISDRHMGWTYHCDDGYGGQHFLNHEQ